MTAGPETTPSDQATGGEAEVANGIPFEINEIFEFLSMINRITFKSQQIDDPELQKNEKTKIAEDIYNKSKHTFLMRFGGYLEEQHLKDFERLCLDEDESSNEEQKSEMSLMLEDFRQRIKSRKLVVKNRRYAAMQDLIKKGEYFSEVEMMKRAPELYEELIGQYLTENEKKLRDGYDVRNTTFSGILMHTMETKEINEVMEEVAKQNRKERKQLEKLMENEEQDEISEDSQSNDHSQSSWNQEKANEDDDDDDVPVNCRQQWGNFDSEQIPCSTSKAIKPKTKSMSRAKEQKKSKNTFITAGERDLLRQEFMGLMQEQFLSGEDKDFDYQAVDEDSKLDDLQQLNRDKEDAYFEASDDEAEDQIFDDNAMDGEESEDELDIFMRHLNQHHSLQNG